MTQSNELETKATTALTTARALKVVDELTLAAASAFLVNVKGLAKQVKETFDAPKKAAKAAHQAVIDAEKKHLAPLEEAEAVVKSAVSKYVTAKAEADRKAQEQAKVATAESLDAAGDTETALAVLDSKTVVEKPKMVEGVSVRTTYRFEVVDESKVPDKFWVLDMVALGKAVRAEGKKCDIPGILVIEEQGVAVRS